MTTLREFFIRIGTKTDHAGLNKAKASIDSIGKTALWAGGAMAAFAGSAYMFKSFVDSVTTAGDEMIKAARNIGLSAEEMQKFEYAGGLAGVSIEGMRTSVKFLNKNISEAAEGAGAGKQAFEKLGISVFDAAGKVKTNTQVFSEIADKIGGLRKEQKSATMMELFGRSGVSMGAMLTEGSKGVRDMFERFDELNFAIKGETLEAMEEYNDRVYESELAMKKLKAEFIGPLLPALTKMAVAFREKLGKAIEWVGKNTEKISKGFEMFMKALKFAGIAGLLFTLGKLSFALSGLVGMFTAAGASAVIAWAGALMGPLLLGGAIAAVTLLIDDLWDTYMNPEVETFTRWFLDKLEKDFPTAFESLKAIVNTLKLSMAGLGLMYSKIIGDEEASKIWEQMIKDYGGKVYSASGKVAQSGQDAETIAAMEKHPIISRIAGFPVVKEFLQGLSAANPVNPKMVEAFSGSAFISSPESFTPMSQTGKSYNIGAVNVTTDSANIDELLSNIEVASEKMKGKGQ
ncbi:MAG TPA: phage tail tape measure protein [bacterium]|nr:phage tail tape measure protein [bacterium]